MKQKISAFLLGLFLFSATSQAGTPHYISITSSNKMDTRWSAYADLYDGKGHRVYHWQETDHKAGDSIHWNYTDGGDGGWVHIWIDPSPSQRFPYLTQTLKTNHCYNITEPQLGFFSKVETVQC